MIRDIVRSEIPLNKTKQEVVTIFGEPTWNKEDVFIYAYSNSILDGCNKLRIEFLDDVCISFSEAGCD